MLMSRSVEKRLTITLKARDEKIKELEDHIKSLDMMLAHCQEECGLWKEMYERQSERLEESRQD